MTHEFYEAERSDNLGNLCRQLSKVTSCNDNVLRYSSWKGSVGLMYPSDFGYATNENDSESRQKCLNAYLYSWNGLTECFNNDWLYEPISQWTMTASAATAYAYLVFNIYSDGSVTEYKAYNIRPIRPVVYLKLQVTIVSGQGAEENPYIISL